MTRLENISLIQTKAILLNNIIVSSLLGKLINQTATDDITTKYIEELNKLNDSLVDAIDDV